MLFIVQYHHVMPSIDAENASCHERAATDFNFAVTLCLIKERRSTKMQQQLHNASTARQGTEQFFFIGILICLAVLFCLAVAWVGHGTCGDYPQEKPTHLQSYTYLQKSAALKPDRSAGRKDAAA